MSPIEVDARGLRCPLPVIRLAEAARDAPDGSRIIVLATDPAARHDVPAWCRMRGQELREITEVPDPSGPDAAPAEGAHPAYLRFVVVVRVQRSKAAGAGSDSERSSRPT
jgi:tRNA 2-thiouridine synthesizing protein A